MSKITPNPLQTLANTSALKRAAAQYRLARLFTPYGFEPERVDYDRVAAFIDKPRTPFVQPTAPMDAALARIESELTEANALLGAFAAQGIEPTLDSEQLFTSARANVINPAMARAA